MVTDVLVEGLETVKQPDGVVSVVGLGLIGGSLARALKQFTHYRVYGFDADPETLRQAQLSGAVDFAAGSLKETVASGDIVIFCLPVRSVIAAMEQARNWWKQGAIISDAASTKLALDQAAKMLIPPYACYIGGHPMAGSEKSGFAAGSALLFQGRPWVLTGGDVQSLAGDTLSRLLRAIGAVPLLMDPKTHDEATAQVSHLPHILAGALTMLNFSGVHREWGCRLAAGGFRDMTRIAESDAAMWVDICLTNASPIIAGITGLQRLLEEFRAAVEQRDEKQIKAYFLQSKEEHQMFVAEAAAAVDDRKESDKHE